MSNATQDTLVERQDDALAQMSQPRSSESRAAKHRSAVLRQYRLRAAKMGYTKEQIDQQIRDLWDMHNLENRAVQGSR